MAKKKLTALGAYTFAGGFTLGVRRHFDVLAHFEETSYGVETAKLNHPGLPIYINPKDWPREEYGHVDFVYGNPPCAAWSGLGKTIGHGGRWWENDPRVECSKIHLQLAFDTSPKVWAWESVLRAWTTGKDFVEGMAARLVESGYHVYFVLHDAQHLWGRQRRHRIFVVASRVALDWRCPFVEPIPTEQSLMVDFPQAMRDRYGKKIPEQSAATGNITRAPKAFLNYVQPGQAFRNALRDWDAKGRKRLKGMWNFGYAVIRLPRERVANTMVGCETFHPIEPRPLTLEEYKFMCSYPVDWKFHTKSYGACVSLMTRAVLPATAEWLAENVRRGILRAKPIDPGYTLVDFMRPPGAINPYEPVTQE